MKRGNNSYSSDPFCDVCGDLVGGTSDHSECSKARIEMYGDSSVNKNPKRKLSAKACDSLCDHINFITDL